jgi:hypothetical protein
MREARAYKYINVCNPGDEHVVQSNPFCARRGFVLRSVCFCLHPPLSDGSTSSQFGRRQGKSTHKELMICADRTRLLWQKESIHSSIIEGEAISVLSSSQSDTGPTPRVRGECPRLEPAPLSHPGAFVCVLADEQVRGTWKRQSLLVAEQCGTTQTSRRVPQVSGRHEEQPQSAGRYGRLADGGFAVHHA